MSDGPEGLRERKKRRTREAVRAAAFRLFEEQGYQTTTVEQIAEAADVSSRTFFRYFPNKADLLIPDQFIDRTRGRISTFCGDGIVAHVSLADPVCTGLSSLLAEAAGSTGASMHSGGTYVCMEGPQFSTRAESQLYRSWGGQVIGMTNIQEAKLAREAELCFSTLALVTDYDCWRSGEEGVDVDEILAVLGANVEVAKSVVGVAARRFDGMAACGCKRALDGAVITDSGSIPAQRHQQLELILKRVETGKAETERERQV